MDVIHLHREEFAGHVALRDVCLLPNGDLIASGYAGPGPNYGDLVRIEHSTGRLSRIECGFRSSQSLVYDKVHEQLIVSANDGTDSLRSASSPDGIFRVDLDDNPTRVEQGSISGNYVPLTSNEDGNIYTVGNVTDDVGQGIIEICPNGEMQQIASGYRQILGLAVAQDGALVVADAESDANKGVLLKVATDGSHGVTVLVYTQGIRPQFVTCGRDGIISVVPS